MYFCSKTFLRFRLSSTLMYFCSKTFLRFRLSSTLKRQKTPMKTKTFENGNAKSVTCHRFQSRTQGPLAFWSAGGRQERHWRIENFFDWLPRIGLHCFTCGNKIPVPQSLSWRPPADQRTLGTVPVQIGTSIEDGGWSCDVNTCAVPCPSRFHRFRAFYCR